VVGRKWVRMFSGMGSRFVHGIFGVVRSRAMRTEVVTMWCRTMDDLKEEYTQCTFPDSISVKYKGLRVHQIPPNGQGITGLMRLVDLLPDAV